MLKNTVIYFENNLKLGTNILFEGKVYLGKNNKIDSNCTLKNVKLGNNNHIKTSSIINSSKLSNNIIVHENPIPISELPPRIKICFFLKYISFSS